MANNEKLKFLILDVSGNNYLSWYLDVELHCKDKALPVPLMLNYTARTRPCQYHY